jgi:hypothetical protein
MRRRSFYLPIWRRKPSQPTKTWWTRVGANDFIKRKPEAKIVSWTMSCIALRYFLSPARGRMRGTLRSGRINELPETTDVKSVE